VTLNKNSKAYIIGGGIAGMAAAVYLIKDAGMDGKNIFIIDQKEENGGSLDGQGSAENGYVCRGYRMYEKSIYTATFDLFSKIPSPEDRRKTLKDDFFEFNKKIKINSQARFIEKGKIVDAHSLGLSRRDRINLIKLSILSEKYLDKDKINEYFTREFFKTNFWYEFSTALAFEPWHSLVEMKRYVARFVQDAGELDTLSFVLSAPYCDHDFIVKPLVKMLKENGVNLVLRSRVSDIVFSPDNNRKIVTKISFSDPRQTDILIGKNDPVFFTNGSLVADSSYGSTNAPPPTVGKSTAWDLWKKISKKFPDLGNPEAFCGSVNETKLLTFTVTFNNPEFFDRVEELTGNDAGTGGIITFNKSKWLMSITLPHQPYFMSQPKNTFVCGGCGLFPDKKGDYLNKKMSDCTGAEILEELCYQLGFGDWAQAIIQDAKCIPVMLPYATSQFMPREKTDRPRVVPAGSQNFALIGQFVEIPNEIAFTVECSVRSAKIAVKELLGLKTKIPLLYQKQFNPKYSFRAIKTFWR
jgi:oleate hydratase